MLHNDPLVHIQHDYTTGFRALFISHAPRQAQVLEMQGTLPNTDHGIPLNNAGSMNYEILIYT